MIIKPGEWLFISTMKCATNTLYKALTEPEVGGLWAGGKNFHALPRAYVAGKKGTSVCLRLAPLHWTCCRNPYSRAVSIWASTCLNKENTERYDAKRWIQKQGGDPADFADFARHVLARPDAKLRVPFLWRDQCSWQDQFIHDVVLKVENIEAEIAELLGLELELPQENTSPHADWKSYYIDPEIREIVREWGWADFKRFEYEP